MYKYRNSALLSSHYHHHLHPPQPQPSNLKPLQDGILNSHFRRLHCSPFSLLRHSRLLPSLRNRNRPRLEFHRKVSGLLVPFYKTGAEPGASSPQETTSFDVFANVDYSGCHEQLFNEAGYCCKYKSARARERREREIIKANFVGDR